VRPAAFVFDFDGTIYRGNAPYRYYGERIAEELPPAEREPYLRKLAAWLEGDLDADAADGWEAAVVLARGSGGDGQGFGEAFRQTRVFMHTDACPLEVPSGLPELLGELAGQLRLVLVTNTPMPGVLPLLGRLGLAEAFDELCTRSGKPMGFERRLRALAEVLDVEPARVVSIGDHFRNDIAPAIAAGCTTVYIDPFRRGPTGRADLEVRRLEDALGPLRAMMSGLAHAETGPDGAGNLLRPLGG
jgi:FMN phosphatase YigB (HAD superfamily)